ncbi:MAG: hypothetical protein QOH54_2715, partial [Mycobacterium sp.]|nr:hypothetical protein [Mycobacterium sp.]
MRFDQVLTRRQPGALRFLRLMPT